MKWLKAGRVEFDTAEAEGDRLVHGNRTVPVRRSADLISIASYTLLISVILIQAILLIRSRTELADRPPTTTLFGLKTARDIPRTSGLLNKYWQGDGLEEPNKAWDAINSGHGAIVISPEFKEQHGLPDSIRHPFHQNMYAYALEAYHMLHCIQVLRKDFLLTREGKSPTKPLEHAMHCFDALRQSVMCQASDELLVITGRGHASGFNQTRMCRNWDDLRDLATAKTACYWDDDLPPEKEDRRWAMCDGGYDGLPIGAILE
ncbi:hypothetical protein AC579_4847 [Pseudocercospora musae]|uniref:Uncharacterized protein n=1 Tax=Pseudocercospora musae TaxID=113226 RepID=A0A139IKE9_9PEZI|nr:hypothetical protein AC579_4847 [Pseudocercospora musae]